MKRVTRNQIIAAVLATWIVLSHNACSDSFESASNLGQNDSASKSLVVIKSESVDLSVESGAIAEFFVILDADVTVNYQWQYATSDIGPFANIDGATQSSYRINSVSESNVGFYQLRVRYADQKEQPQEIRSRIFKLSLLARPTPSPTIMPSPTVTVAPTVAPTRVPTLAPTVAPTRAPTAAPTLAPTATPRPTAAPTSTPAPSPTPSGPTPTPLPFNEAQDWLNRSRGSGVFYAENFSAYSTEAEIQAAGYNSSMRPLSEASYHVYRGVGGPPMYPGAQALEMRTYDTAERNGGDWMIRNWGGVRNGFYIQFQVAYNRAGIAWRSINTPGELKTIFIGGNGYGQVLVHNPRHQGFPALFFDGSGGGNLERVTSSSGRYPGDFYTQTAINSGFPAVLTDIRTGLQRYGPARGINNGSSALHDYSYIAGNASANYLDNRGFSFPNADAISAGAQPYLIDQWLVIQVYYERVSDPNLPDKVYMWAAPRGQPPRRISGTWPLTGAGSLNRTKFAGVGTSNPTGIDLVRLGNYDTKRKPEPGYRPVMKTYYNEVIGSHRWIPFPGHPNVGEP